MVMLLMSPYVWFPSMMPATRSRHSENLPTPFDATNGKRTRKMLAIQGALALAVAIVLVSSSVLGERDRVLDRNSRVHGTFSRKYTVSESKHIRRGQETGL